MTKHFRVAEHDFSLTVPDSFGADLSNYLPFEVGETDSSIFSVETVGELPELEKTVLISGDHGEPLMPLCNIYDCAEGWWIEMAPTGTSPIASRMLLSKDCCRARLLCLSDNPYLLKFAVDNALMLTFALRTATLGTLEIHASVTVNDGKGYLFLGKSGTGKSTHSRLWIENVPGCHLLNDDNPILRAWPDGRVTVYGSPWSGKTPCYRNEEAPAEAFVRIVQAPENRLEKVSAVEAYGELYSSCSGLKFVDSMSDGIHETLVKCVTGVPSFRMHCLPDADAALTCHRDLTR